MTASEGIDVRVARPSDVADLRAFGATQLPAIYGSLFDAVEVERQLDTWWTESYLRAGIDASRVIGAFLPDRVVGVAQFGELDDLPVLYKLYVAADLRGSGLGPRLLRAVDGLLDALDPAIPLEQARVAGVLEVLARLDDEG